MHVLVCRLSVLLYLHILNAEVSIQLVFTKCHVWRFRLTNFQETYCSQCNDILRQKYHRVAKCW